MHRKPPTLWIIASFLFAFLISACSPNTPVPVVSQDSTQPYPEPKVTEVNPYPGSSPIPGEPTQAQTTAPAIPPTSSPTQVLAQQSSKWIAYIGADGNLWLIASDGSQKKSVTVGAVDYQPGSEKEGLVFSDPLFSSDGQLLVYTRRIDRASETGIASQFSILIYDLASGNTRILLENQQVTGYSWRPDTHKLAYAFPVENGYFTRRGEVDPTKARGIWELDVDSGQFSELVLPHRDLSLVRPDWSPKGDRLSFQEVYLTEGQGKFAFYDFKTGKYIAWDRPIGGFSWSPDEKAIIYDTLSYTPTPGNQIWKDDGLGLNEVALTGKDDTAYVIFPKFSPGGDTFAYIGQKMEPVSNDYQVYIQSLEPGSKPKIIGTFDQPGYPSWSPDGKYLLLSYGPYPQQKIVKISVVDGTTQQLEVGSQPVWQP